MDPVTWNLEPGRWEPVPGTWLLGRGTLSLGPGTGNLEPGACDLESGTWDPVPGTWILGRGALNLGEGTGALEPGTCVLESGTWAPGGERARLAVRPMGGRVTAITPHSLAIHKRKLSCFGCGPGGWGDGPSPGARAGPGRLPPPCHSKQHGKLRGFGSGSGGWLAGCLTGEPGQDSYPSHFIADYKGNLVI